MSRLEPRACSESLVCLEPLAPSAHVGPLSCRIHGHDRNHRLVWNRGHYRFLRTATSRGFRGHIGPMRSHSTGATDLLGTTGRDWNRGHVWNRSSVRNHLPPRHTWNRFPAGTTAMLGTTGLEAYQIRIMRPSRPMPTALSNGVWALSAPPTGCNQNLRTHRHSPQPPQAQLLPPLAGPTSLEA